MGPLRPQVRSKPLTPRTLQALQRVTPQVRPRRPLSAQRKHAKRAAQEEQPQAAQEEQPQAAQEGPQVPEDTTVRGGRRRGRKN
eukprot:6084989-Amphidinium_carterae.1